MAAFGALHALVGGLAVVFFGLDQAQGAGEFGLDAHLGAGSLQHGLVFLGFLATQIALERHAGAIEQGVDLLPFALEQAGQVVFGALHLRAGHQCPVEDDLVAGFAHWASLSMGVEEVRRLIGPGSCRQGLRSKCQQLPRGLVADCAAQLQRGGLTTARMTTASRNSTGASLNQR
jgi:hypothetical protein